MKNEKKQKKRSPFFTTVIAVLSVVITVGICYQGYRLVRDFVLEKVLVYFLDNDAEQETSVSVNTDKMDIGQVADAFERLNGVEPDDEAEPEKTEKNTDNNQVAKDIVGQIPEADKNRAIAIVSSVASVDDCFALYELAINGDQNAKNQLKAIYARFTQAQTDELWALYEKNKHLLEKK